MFELHSEGQPTPLATCLVLLVLLVLILLLLQKWKTKKISEPATNYPNYPPVELVHQLYPVDEVLKNLELDEKEKLNQRLNTLSKNLAEKEGRLQISKTKIRETQYEIENLQALDEDIHIKYREVMSSLRKDLISNEQDCKKLQEQIELVSRKRAEIRDDVHQGQRIYGEAAAELVSSLVEMQRGRVTEKPTNQSHSSLRCRQTAAAPYPRLGPLGSIVLKTPPGSPPAPLCHESQY